MRINNNIPGKNAARVFGRNTAEGAKAMKKLASGMRIESAADDAAGLSISEGMRGQIRGLSQASLNAQTGIDLTQTADGALGEISDALSRIKELTVQACNDTNTKEDRKAIQTEIEQLSKHVDMVAKNTEFNAIKITDGSLRALDPTSATEKGNPLPSNFINISDAQEARMSGPSRNSGDQIEIHDGKSAYVKVMTNDPIDIVAYDPNDKLSLVYKNNGTVQNIELNLTSYIGIGNFLGTPLTASISRDNLANYINNAIRDFCGSQKIAVNAADAPYISFTSVDKNSSTMIEMDTNSEVFKKMLVPAVIPDKVISKSGIDRNDKLFIDYSHKLKTSESKFTKEDGYTITEPVWEDKHMEIDITHGTRSFKAIMDEVESKNLNSGEFTIKSEEFTAPDGSKTVSLSLNTIDKGSRAIMSITSSGSLASSLGIGGYREGIDKNDTFAIEVNAKYVQVDVDEDRLSIEDKKQLIDKGILYNEDGYIIEDPINPQDYIKYTKIKGSGELVEINLYRRNNYSEEDLAREIQDKINAQTIDKNNDVKIMVKDGALVMETDKKLGTFTSVKFMAPSSTDPKTSGEELLKNFLKTAGFDYNRHIGCNGTGKMDIQVGANENQNLRIKIGSLRSGALGIKYLDVTDRASAEKTLETINKAILRVADEHAGLGAYENVLAHVRANVENSSENLSTAESRIRDCDMAKEFVTLSKSNILSQASQAMMAQAKSQPEAILQLLK